MKPYIPEVPLMTFQATPNELIALGHVITQYLHQFDRTQKKTKEQLEIIILLQSFQGRLVSHVQNPPLQQPPGFKEVPG